VVPGATALVGADGTALRYAKLVLCNGRVQGALFASRGESEHDVETFENLILSQVVFCLLLTSLSHRVKSNPSFLTMFFFFF
jgi:hypothetical protein